ncbi:MAG TPA: peptide-methionine (R)-S-oxide reductase MsrB [Micropepsaceae bacterium]|nr:peptide-methionine (R)-S-oxide reductase MsrB [Micropepsaceae bacterium]
MIARRSLILGSASALVLSARAHAASRFEITRTDEEWRALLTPDQYAVLRQQKTEQPYSSLLDNEHRKGAYACAGCGLAVFSSQAKYNSNTGWPSFFEPLPRATVMTTDRSQGQTRTECYCRRCGGHLGHVFGDGPPPTHLRYCLNGLSLTFKPG